MSAWTDAQEKKSLDLVTDLQIELREALNSLGGKTHEGLPETYYFYSSAQMNRAAEAFVLLRRAARVDSSKLLVRPAIEVLIRVEGIRKEPELMFRVAYTEKEEDAKWIRPASLATGVAYDQAAYKTQWETFKKAYAAKFPGQKLIEKKLSLADAARLAGLEPYYDTHYRMYCKFTHVSLRASIGYLNELTDPEDNRTMALCIFAAVSWLKEMGAASPNFDSLQARLHHIDDA